MPLYPQNKGELLITLVKNAETDIVLAASISDRVLEKIGKSSEDIISRKSSETWPDQNGNRYRSDDRRVIEGQEPIYGRFEQLTIQGEDYFVFTDKFPVRDHQPLVLVMVYSCQEQGLAFSEKGYVVAILNLKELREFSPNAPEDVPPNIQDIMNQEEKYSLETGPNGTSFMRCEDAEKLTYSQNTSELNKSDPEKWRVLLPGSYWD